MIGKPMGAMGNSCASRLERSSLIPSVLSNGVLFQAPFVLFYNFIFSSEFAELRFIAKVCRPLGTTGNGCASHTGKEGIWT